MLEIDGYHIFAELKRGPTTTIFKALDTRHGRIVLIKLLHAEAAAETNRLIQFLRESNINALMVHPNLRHIYQSGAVGDAPFLALEYVEGPTLAELIRKGSRLPIDICLFIAKELARAIAAVHRYNVLHLDIKPHNIFISYTGNVKLGDLGFARDLVDSAGNSITGTPAYMAPEQILGLEISKASDLFSFGAVFYEMLTGETAFANQTLSGTLRHVANWDPVPISRLRPEVPVEFVAACQRLLAKNPAERYPDAETVIEQLSWLEHMFCLTITPHHLAEFISSPETYRQVALEQRVPRPRATETKYGKTANLSWGLAAVVSATMFLAGVLYIWGVKSYLQNKPGRPEIKSVASTLLQPLPDSSRLGYFALQVHPDAASGVAATVVYIDGDSLGVVPLEAPIALPTGPHEISIFNPRWGEKKMQIDIVAGETLRQTIDLTKP